MTNAALAVFTIAINHVLIAWLKQRFPRFAMVADGTPIIIVEHRHWHLERMSRMRLQEQDVMAVARQGGIRHLDEIDTAIVERNGAISVFKIENGPEA